MEWTWTGSASSGLCAVVRARSFNANDAVVGGHQDVNLGLDLDDGQDDEGTMLVRITQALQDEQANAGPGRSLGGTVATARCMS